MWAAARPPNRKLLLQLTTHSAYGVNKKFSHFICHFYLFYYAAPLALSLSLPFPLSVACHLEQSFFLLSLLWAPLSLLPLLCRFGLSSCYQLIIVITAIIIVIIVELKRAENGKTKSRGPFPTYVSWQQAGTACRKLWQLQHTHTHTYRIFLAAQHRWNLFAA